MPLNIFSKLSKLLVGIFLFVYFFTGYRTVINRSRRWYEPDTAAKSELTSKTTKHVPMPDHFTSFVKRRTNATFAATPGTISESIACTDCPVQHTLVMVVKSKAANAEKREFLRRTWASVSYLNGWHFKTVYLIGLPKLDSEAALLAEEQARYDDLLLFNGSDKYYDLPYKVSEGCSR